VSAAELLLKRLVEKASGGAETGYVLVIDGEGFEDLPPQVPTPEATYCVHRARTELGLRHLLWQARGAPIIAVLPEELASGVGGIGGGDGAGGVGPPRVTCDAGSAGVSPASSSRRDAPNLATQGADPGL